ncbi:hypothetical protein ACQEVZ_55230 [Dactylosporangium sp. CA-152071]|uniref:hypothetical protein n=1 Tax=Dactylosporangium sp. CA-152071 TaxID=3239933 RepID=UPI003D93C18E
MQMREQRANKLHKGTIKPSRSVDHRMSARAEFRERRQFAALDVRSGDRAIRLIDDSAVRTARERVDELRDLARRVGANADDAVRRVGYREIVEAAGAALAPGSPATVFVWSLCSGITHGDFWTTLNAAERVELPGAPAGMVSFKVTADVEKLRFATDVAVNMTLLGWRLHDERSRAPY